MAACWKRAKAAKAAVPATAQQAHTDILSAYGAGWHGQPRVAPGAVSARNLGLQRLEAPTPKLSTAAPQPQRAARQLLRFQDENLHSGELDDWMLSEMEEEVAQEEEEEDAVEPAPRAAGACQQLVHQAPAVPPHGSEAAPLPPSPVRAESAAQLESAGGEASAAGGELPALRAISAPPCSSVGAGGGATPGQEGQQQQQQKQQPMGMRRVAAIAAWQPELEQEPQQPTGIPHAEEEASAVPPPPAPAPAQATPFRRWHPACHSRLHTVVAQAVRWTDFHRVAEDMRIRRANGWHGVVLGDQFEPRAHVVGFEVRASTA